MFRGFYLPSLHSVSLCVLFCMIIRKRSEKPKKKLEYCIFALIMSLYNRKTPKNYFWTRPFQSGPVWVGQWTQLNIQKIDMKCTFSLWRIMIALRVSLNHFLVPTCFNFLWEQTYLSRNYDIHWSIWIKENSN